MTTEQKNIECAKRDGWKFGVAGSFSDKDGLLQSALPNYHSSRDAIIPLIEKQPRHIVDDLLDALWPVLQHGCSFKNTRTHFDYYDAGCLLLATPQQLQDALLRAWGIEP